MQNIKVKIRYTSSGVTATVPLSYAKSLMRKGLCYLIQKITANNKANRSIK